MKPKITIIDGNNEIELSTVEENIKAYMVKGEKGADGTSPTASVSKTGSTSNLIVTDATGTTQTNILDGYNPTITTSRTGHTTTITTTDINGTTDTEIYDGIDLTGGVPTDGIIGWAGADVDIPNGYEATTELQEKLVSGTNIKTINNTSILGNGNISIGRTSVNDSYSSSTTEPYSCNYVNNLNTYSTSERVVGKTENGETIYEKTINYTTALTSGFNAIPHGITNKDKNIKAWGHINGSPYYLGAYENANAFININYADATSVGIVVGTQWGNAFQSGCTVTIQYTKTTN